MSGPQALTPTIPSDAIIEQGGFKLVSVQNLGDELKQALKDTVAQGTSDTQLAYFLTVAEAQGLNPFMKEVWCILYGGKLTIQTGRDGYLKIAKRDPLFDSIQSAEVREGDVFTMDTSSGAVEHRITPNRGKILGAYAIITRKDGQKLCKYLTLSEYQGDSPIWKKFPTAMICKAAESALCKQFANISGVMAEELMPVEHADVIDSSPSNGEASSSMKVDLLAKIEACKTIAEFDALKATMPPIIGKLFDAEKKEVFAAANAKKEALLQLDVTPVKEQPVVDAAIVEKETPAEEADARDEAAEEPQETPKATVDEAKTMLRECETLEALEECWTNVIPTLGLDDIEMHEVGKTYKFRIPKLTGKAPQKEKAA